MSTLLLILGSAIFIIAFLMYNKGVIAGTNTPAFAAWALFSVIMLVNCLTYLDWTADWTNILVFGTDFVICVGTSIFILVKCQWKVSVDWKDKAIASVSLIAVMLWIAYNNAEAGNWLNQVAYSIAFIPTYRNVLRNPLDEPTKPWFLWTIAFVLNIIALAVDPKSQPMDYVTPAVCLVHHTALTALSLRKSS
jgi:hypothetical protein